MAKPRSPSSSGRNLGSQVGRFIGKIASRQISKSSNEYKSWVPQVPCFWGPGKAIRSTRRQLFGTLRLAGMHDHARWSQFGLSSVTGLVGLYLSLSTHSHTSFSSTLKALDTWRTMSAMRIPYCWCPRLPGLRIVRIFPSFSKQTMSGFSIFISLFASSQPLSAGCPRSLAFGDLGKQYPYTAASCLALSVARITALISVTRKPPSSSSRMPSMVQPAGVVTASFSRAGW